MTGRADYYAEGDWNAVCFECGRKRKASQLKKHWKGYYVCPEHWEPREAQDFVRSVPDMQTPPHVQPMPADSFGQARLSTSEITSGNSGIAITTLLYADIPWNPAGSTIANFVLTDYVTSPSSGMPSVRIVIPEGTIITGSFSFGSGWPIGTEFIISNSGSVLVTPTWPSNTNVTLNGKVYGTAVESPSYTVQWNGWRFALPTWILTAGRKDLGSPEFPDTYAIGYSSGIIGSISPTTFSDAAIIALSSVIDGLTSNTAIGLAGILAPDFLTSITSGGVTLSAASATYASQGGVTVWQWYNVTLFTAEITYSVNLS